MLALLIVLNLAISAFNAWAVGDSWHETKVVGGFPRFMAWMGAIMAAVGFSWVSLILIALAAGPAGFGKMPDKYVQATFDLGYLAIIIPCIGSGLAITVDSWAYFWRKRTFGGGAVASYNTFADAYNMYSALQYAPTAWEHLADIFGGSSHSSSDDDDDGWTKWVIILAAIAILAGVMATVIIIKTVSANRVAERRHSLCRCEVPIVLA